jgi:ferredoxin-NADP reductase
MLRYIEDERLPHRVTLIYSSRNCASAPFLDELEAIERPNQNIRLIVTMTEDEAWPGERRRIDADFVKSHLGKSFNEASYMVAGPPGFAKAVSAELEQAGVDSARIATDSFSGY